MARTPLTRALRRRVRAHEIARRTGMPLDEVLDGAPTPGAPTPPGRQISRREVLAGTAAGGAALA
ncbi:MAG TPA: twin-arginine translocation signal domain-containing protein, partial [Acidimicrobiia bacterium]